MSKASSSAEGKFCTCAKSGNKRRKKVSDKLQEGGGREIVAQRRGEKGTFRKRVQPAEGGEKTTSLIKSDVGGFRELCWAGRVKHRGKRILDQYTSARESSIRKLGVV